MTGEIMSHLTKEQLRTLSVPEMSLVEDRLRELVQTESQQLGEIAQYILDLGGKRLRPLLTLLCSDIYGANLDIRVDIAAAAELIHTASLLHDDVVDEADLRRGQPSAPNKWGNAKSVLAGDFLFAKAFSILSAFPGALEIMTDAIAAMCQAELSQLGAQYDLRVTADTYVKIIIGKTASLLAASCECGGLISSMPLEQVDLLGKYGIHLGLAYQIIDDIGDYVLGTAHSGKNHGNDLKNGTTTLPLLYVLADPQSRSRVESLLAQHQRVEPEMLARELTETRALERATDVASKHIGMAREMLVGLPRCHATLVLDGLAGALQERCTTLSNHAPVPQRPGQPFQYSGT